MKNCQYCFKKERTVSDGALPKNVSPTVEECEANTAVQTMNDEWRDNNGKEDAALSIYASLSLIILY
jgi:hypothetical protein